MAYCRLGHIKENKGAGGASKGLMACIEYIYNPAKTNGLDYNYIGGYNMVLDKDNIVESVYENMMNTKELFGKPMGRQGYHYKLSFPSTDKITPELALKITTEFCEKAFTDYECAFSVHDNTDHMHSHIIINSIDLVRIITLLFSLLRKWLKRVQITRFHQHQRDQRDKRYKYGK